MAIVVGALFLSVVGLIDDTQSLPASLRLIVQLAAGVAVGASLGDSRTAALASLCFMLLVNTVNFMDGINGLSGVFGGIWGFSSLLLGWQYDSLPSTAVGAIVLGGSLGFLPWNFPRAKIFLGDSGSYLLGGLIAGTTIYHFAIGLPVAPVIAPLLIYVLDVLFTLVRRASLHRPLLEAHRDHIYQRLNRHFGMDHWRTTILVGIVMALLVTVSFSSVPTMVLYAIFLLVGIAYCASPSFLRWLARPVSSGSAMKPSMKVTQRHPWRHNDNG